MISLFTCPKPFRGHLKLIQGNAIRSWSLLTPCPEIILFGDDEGVAEMARKLEVRHIPSVTRNEFGTPLVSDLFAQAQRLAASEFLGYINTDIILMDDFLQALAKIGEYHPQFLMVGQRWNLDLREPVDFSTGWQERLKLRVAREGELEDVSGMDFFAFRRGLYPDMPLFAIGRTAWDGWLMYSARSRRIPAVDVTKSVLVVHQNHDYGHIAGGRQGAWKGVEALRNQELAGGHDFFFTVRDADWVSNDGDLTLASTPEYHQRARQTWLLLHYPRLHRLWRAIRGLRSALLESLPAPLASFIRRLYASIFPQRGLEG